VKARLRDLVTFAQLEVEANDIEPWADILTWLYANEKLGIEEALWATKLYNAYDDFGSGFRVFERFHSPAAWARASQPDQEIVNKLPMSQERRNLRGGRAIKHFESYVEALDGLDQEPWLLEIVDPFGDPFENYASLMERLRGIWGVGRQTAFEWAEFVGKVAGLPVETSDGALWESSGPRESLERLYQVYPKKANEDQLSYFAEVTKMRLAEHGVKLSWWDFETVICDYNVMTKGRYYPGQHIAMVREEIEGLADPYQSMLMEAFMAVIPAPWNEVPGGASKDLRRAYRDLGVIITPVGGKR